jgi:hypothetical protein
MLTGLRQMKENLSSSRRGTESREAGRADRRQERGKTRRSAGVHETPAARRQGSKA